MSLKAIVAAAIIFASFSANAGTAFKVDEFQQNGDRICVYDYLGHRHYLNVGYKICPISLHVN